MITTSSNSDICVDGLTLDNWAKLCKRLKIPQNDDVYFGKIS